MERWCAGVIDAAGLARGEMGEDCLDEFGGFDAGDDTQRTATRATVFDVDVEDALEPLHPTHGSPTRRIRRDQRLEAVEIAPVDDGVRSRPHTASMTIDGDALYIGHGLAPATEVPRLLRAVCVFDRARGGWRPETDALGRTSVAGLYVAGDGAGILGGQAALLAGRTVGVAIAADLCGTVPGRSRVVERLAGAAIRCGDDRPDRDEVRRRGRDTGGDDRLPVRGRDPRRDRCRLRWPVQ